MNAIAVPEIATPRPAKLLILAAVLLGELFVTGYFFDAQDKTEISANTSEFLGKATIYSIASSLLMIPLKIIICIFLVAKPISPTATREQIEGQERNRNLSRKIGYISIALWLGVCGWGIIMFALSFNEIALDKWLLTYFGTFFSEVVVIFQLKLLFKVLFGFLLMKLLRSRFMLTIAGFIAGKIVDFIMKLF